MSARRNCHHHSDDLLRRLPIDGWTDLIIFESTIFFESSFLANFKDRRLIGSMLNSVFVKRDSTHNVYRAGLKGGP